MFEHAEIASLPSGALTKQGKFGLQLSEVPKITTKLFARDCLWVSLI